MITAALVLTAVLAIGVLVGSTWTVHAAQDTFRARAAERRDLDEQWQLLATEQQRRTRCGRCGAAVPGDHGWSPAARVAVLDDDD